MSDAPVIHISENSPEYVAYKLLNHIALVEGIGNVGFGNYGEGKWTRRQLLDAYSECLRAVRPISLNDERVPGPEGKFSAPFVASPIGRSLT